MMLKYQRGRYKRTDVETGFIKLWTGGTLEKVIKNREASISVG